MRQLASRFLLIMVVVGIIMPIQVLASNIVLSINNHARADLDRIDVTLYAEGLPDSTVLFVFFDHLGSRASYDVQLTNGVADLKVAAPSLLETSSFNVSVMIGNELYAKNVVYTPQEVELTLINDSSFIYLLRSGMNLTEAGNTQQTQPQPITQQLDQQTQNIPLTNTIDDRVNTAQESSQARIESVGEGASLANTSDRGLKNGLMLLMGITIVLLLFRKTLSSISP